MRQVITTKYLPATNVKGSRVKASCQAGSITLHWDHSLNSDDNHVAAAQALASKLKWDGNWVGGFNRDSQGVFVLLLSGDQFNVEKLAKECPRCGLLNGHRYPCV